MNATSGGIRLVVDNPGFRPDFVTSGLRRRRDFDARFRLVRNQLPVLASASNPTVSPTVPADRNRETPGTPKGETVMFKSTRKSVDLVDVPAEHLANWLEQNHSEHCVRRPAEMESVNYADRLPSDQVVDEAIRIMRARGYAVRTLQKSGDIGASFFVLRRWS